MWKPVVALALALAVAAGCSRAVVTDAAWRADVRAPVTAVCTVTEHRPPERVGGQQWRDFVSEYDAAGRLIRKIDQPELGSTAHTRYRYDAAGRLVGTSALIEREAYDGNCDSEDGCAGPERREIVETVYERDGAGRIVEERTDARRFEEDRKQPGRWVEIDRDKGYVNNVFGDHGRLVERRGERGTARYEYRGDKPIRRTWREGGYPPSHSNYTYDAAGRLIRAQWVYDDHLVYDARDRLIAIRTTDEHSEREEYWEYDAAGRVTRAGRRNRYHRSGAFTDAYSVFTYDAAGHMVAMAHNGLPPSVELTYEGRCDRVKNAQQPPVPLAGVLELCAAVKCPVD